jgi:hypothetical protein
MLLQWRAECRLRLDDLCRLALPFCLTSLLAGTAANDTGERAIGGAVIGGGGCSGGKGVASGRSHTQAAEAATATGTRAAAKSHRLEPGRTDLGTCVEVSGAGARTAFTATGACTGGSSGASVRTSWLDSATT